MNTTKNQFKLDTITLLAAADPISWDWYPERQSELIKVQMRGKTVSAMPLISAALSKEESKPLVERLKEHSHTRTTVGIRPFSEEYRFTTSRDLPGVKKGERAIMTVHNAMQGYLLHNAGNDHIMQIPTDVPITGNYRENLEDGQLPGKGPIPLYSVQDVRDGKVKDSLGPHGVLLSEKESDQALAGLKRGDNWFELDGKKAFMQSPHIAMWLANPDDMEQFYKEQVHGKDLNIQTSTAGMYESALSKWGKKDMRNDWEEYEKNTSARNLYFSASDEWTCFATTGAFRPTNGNSLLAYKQFNNADLLK